LRRLMTTIALLCALADVGVAQQPSSTPAFEAASVKANTTGAPGWSVSYTADSVRATNATLEALIISAYGIRSDRLVGGPNWVRSTRFDVTGKGAQVLPREQLRRMAQHLLEDRFGLVLTREQREEETYMLRLARSDGRMGPDVRRAADDCLGDAGGGGVPTNLPAAPALKSSTGADPTFSGRCATIAGLADGLSRSLGVGVVDETGLQGRWDWVIAYTKLTANPSAGLAPEPTNLPTVFTAVEEQLGLKLERNPHGTVEYAVITAAHAPTDN
jgi:uncharacterized protein (TIGR03435 family)